MNELDEKATKLLHDGWVNPPSDFLDTVMKNITAVDSRHLQAETVNQAAPVILQVVPWWQWVALTAGSVIGVGQVMRFIFSVWLVTAAG